MNLQQIRYVREAVRQGFNLTQAASVLFTSQPGVSKQIRELEEEIGVQIFVRRGRRLLGLTDPGRMVVETIERLLGEVENLRHIRKHFTDQDSGSLTIATTHTQARYALPPVVQQFRSSYPKVQLSLQEGDPARVAEMVMQGDADIGIATEALDSYPELITLPGQNWHHCVVVPRNHPLAQRKKLTLEHLSTYPIITYSTQFGGRSHIDEAFASRNLVPDIVLTAIDADVVKAYTEIGMGVGIVAAMAYDEDRDVGLCALNAEHLFRPRTTRIAVKRGGYLPGYAHSFIRTLSPDVSDAVGPTPHAVAKARHRSDLPASSVLLKAQL
jgi:LysR family cys regulon transcriptional activator